MKCLLIPILIGLISAILGYLLGRLSKSNRHDCKERIAELEAELAACRKKTSKGGETKKRTASGFLPFHAEKAKAVFGKTIKNNDLTIVEGIGPKIQGLFHKHHVQSWRGLSEYSVEKCQEILSSGGEQYKLHNPKTWPEQAKLAYEVKWKQLHDWQEKLDEGV